MLDRIAFAAASLACLATTGCLDEQGPREHTLEIPGFQVPEGTEVQRCYYFRFPSEVDVDISKIQMDTSEGSHHFQVYVAADDGDTFPEGFSEECFRIVDFERWHMVFASQSNDLGWELPAGVGVRMNAGQQVMIQTHYVNTGVLPTPSGIGGGTLTFTEAATADADTFDGESASTIDTHIGAIFAVNNDIHLPPQSEATAEAVCQFPKDANIAALTGHYHFFGTRFEATVMDESGSMAPKPFYRVDDFKDLRFDTWNDPAAAPRIPEDGGIHWKCTYENTLQGELTFGARETDHEHCNMFTFYYPAEPQEFRACRNPDSDGDNKEQPYLGPDAPEGSGASPY